MHQVTSEKVSPEFSVAGRLQLGLQALSVKHRVGIVAFAAAILTGFGITAVAVAPLASDTTNVPLRTVTETVQPTGLDAQLLALANQELTLTRSDITRGTDTAATLLGRLGVRDPSAAAFLRADSTARQLITGRGGKMVRAQTQADGSLLELVAKFPVEQPELARTHYTKLTVTPFAGRWLASLTTVPYGKQMRLASGTVRSTLFAATDDAGIPDAVAGQIAEIFSTDIDMHRQLRKGDTFSVVYEVLTADGEPVAWNEGVGRVTAAEFVNAGRAYHALWFDQGGKQGNYFGLDGRSKRNAFLASPMEFSRVTSGFAMRFHPLLQKWRQHLGVDYAAPVGTPVRTVGDGVVDFAGVQNGYGNVVEIKHGNERSTLYAHLSRIDVKKGQRVEQGHVVGAVGMTGWTTGPHLHFEFRVKGQHQDPLLAAKETQATALDSASRERFTAVSQQMQAKLDVAETLLGRRTRFE
jgi:murein DD-endopeptidase MepM/ murein hydrolase activator NlpD